MDAITPTFRINKGFAFTVDLIWTYCTVLWFLNQLCEQPWLVSFMLQYNSISANAGIQALADNGAKHLRVHTGKIICSLVPILQ